MARSRVDLTQGPILSKLLTFAMPILLGTIVTQMYNVADSVIVGRFVNKEALAAVSAGAPIMSIIMLFFVGMSSGTSVVVAQRVGADNKEALQRAVGTIACMTVVGSVCLTVFGLLVCKPLLQMLGTPEYILGDTVRYLVVIFIFTTGNMVYQMGNGVLQGMGDSSWPLLFLVGCSILNVILDLAAVLILHLGFWALPSPPAFPIWHPVLAWSFVFIVGATEFLWHPTGFGWAGRKWGGFSPSDCLLPFRMWEIPSPPFLYSPP